MECWGNFPRSDCGNYYYLCAMAKRIEYKIGFQAAIIYIIVALAVVAMAIYLNNLRKNIFAHRLEIENQHTLLASVNDLMFAVSEAQSSVGLYLSTKNGKYFDEYTQSIDSIGNLIDTIIQLKPNEEERLRGINTLLREQSQHIARLNLQFAERNPVTIINELLREYAPHVTEDTSYVLNVQKDTVISEVPRKGFFRRLAEVFSPGKDSVAVMVNQWMDTVITVRNDSLDIIGEVGNVAQRAQKVYERNIKKIERQVGALLSSDRDIAAEVYALLLEFHRETLDATLAMIDRSEEAIDRNYIYSTISGVLTLALMLVFIGMIIMDVNKGRRAHQALEAANERTHRIMESRHKLLLAVSHDIKSPLNSVLGYLALMKSDHNVRSMQNSSEHILSLLENLLEFSSLEQGTLQKSVSDVHLRDLLTDIYDMFLPLAAQKALVLSFTADDVRIRTDRVKLKQMVINLVSNAIKYTKNGSVTVSAKFDNNTLDVEVRDTGVGIPDDKLSQLFMPFSRIEENNAVADGTGLGMFVVKGLTELLGGKITVDSRVGEGTTILLTIPVEHSLQAAPHGVQRIKVYDDDPVVVKVVSDMLVKLGHQVVDSNEELIITDMEMGDISGLDILRQAGAVPVVVMTGRADFSAQQAAALGFAGFLAKPFTIATLRGLVGGSEASDELLGDNRDEIMTLFRASVEENSAKLRQALAGNNFQQAQAVCHKMYPMFAQMNYPTEALRRMDAHRSGAYEGWQDDVEEILAIKV